MQTGPETETRIMAPTKGYTMGLFTGYLLYRHGKKKAERKAELERLELEAEIMAPCEHCGLPEFAHSPDERRLCPF